METRDKDPCIMNPSAVRILCVDDDTDFLKSLVHLLENRGFPVKGVPSGRDAVRTVETEPPFDVVVLDVQMPGMDGIATLAEIRERAPGTQVIMLTGHADVSSGVRAMRSGAYDYLMKPCEVESLVETIRSARSVNRIRQRPVLWHRSRVGDVRIEAFHRVSPDASVLEAVLIFNKRRGTESIDPVYVLDHEDRLLGVVTRREILEAAYQGTPMNPPTWASLSQRPDLVPAMPVYSIMTPPILTAHPGDDLAQSADKMMKNGCQSMAVIGSGQMIGVVRLADLLLHIEGRDES